MRVTCVLDVLKPEGERAHREFSRWVYSLGEGVVLGGAGGQRVSGGTPRVLEVI